VTLLRDRFRRGLRRAVGSIEIVQIPERGIWTVVGLGRGQFFAILLVSIFLFLVLDGPAWRHLRESHTKRIIASYGVIPVLVWVAQWKNQTLGLRFWLEAFLLIALVKFIVTAVLLVALAFLV
jgi:hypothetical protein